MFQYIARHNESVLLLSSAASLTIIIILYFFFVLFCKGPEDKTLHFSIKPRAVITPGQLIHINLTFTPREYRSYLDLIVFSFRTVVDLAIKS